MKGTSLKAQKLNDTLRTLYKNIDDALKAIRQREGSNEDQLPSQVRSYLGPTKREIDALGIGTLSLPTEPTE